MPEGPEIRLAADAIAKPLVNKPVTEIVFAFEHLHVFSPQLDGHIITAVDTRGKAMLTRFDNGLSLYSHNQLYGVWRLSKPGEIWQTNRQPRVVIKNKSVWATLYSASSIEVLDESQIKRHSFLSKLGPDILSENPSVDEIVERLQSKLFSGRALATVLLDQHFLAGLGNYLRAEILAFANIHPFTKARSCSKASLAILAEHIIKITHTSYKTGGVTNKASIITQLKQSGKKTKEAYRFYMYGREGKPCYKCAEIIERIDVGGRHIAFCSQCQSR